MKLLYDPSYLFSDINPDKLYKCQFCNWSGLGEFLISKYVNTISIQYPLSGHEGYDYKCPNCGNIVTSYYSRYA